MAILLIAAQTIWALAIKQQHLLDGSVSKIFTNLLTSSRIWIGIFLYIIATGVYFIVVSKGKFFHVQVLLVCLAVIFAAILAAILFHERITALNIVGIILVLVGLVFILR